MTPLSKVLERMMEETAISIEAVSSIRAGVLPAPGVSKEPGLCKCVHYEWQLGWDGQGCFMRQQDLSLLTNSNRRVAGRVGCLNHGGAAGGKDQADLGRCHQSLGDGH